MANRTVKDAKSVHGTNPQYLIEKIIRSRIYECRFWKEQCFALNAELLVEKAQQVKFVGGVYGGSIKPTPFMCLALKMLQIQPEKEIIIEMIRQSAFKYIRVLAAFYWRLVASSIEVYTILEPLMNDFRKLKKLERDGTVSMVCVDAFVDALLREERVCDVILPRIQKRYLLESQNELEPRVSALDEDLENASTSSSDSEAEKISNVRSTANRKSSDNEDADQLYQPPKRKPDVNAKRRTENAAGKGAKRQKSSNVKQSKIKRGEELEEGETGSSSSEEREDARHRRRSHSRSRSRSSSAPRAYRRRESSPLHQSRERKDADRRRNEKRGNGRERDRHRSDKTRRSRRDPSRSRSHSARSRSDSRERHRARR